MATKRLSIPEGEQAHLTTRAELAQEIRSLMRSAGNNPRHFNVRTVPEEDGAVRYEGRISSYGNPGVEWTDNAGLFGFRLTDTVTGASYVGMIDERHGGGLGAAATERGQATLDAAKPILRCCEVVRESD